MSVGLVGYSVKIPYDWDMINPHVVCNEQTHCCTVRGRSVLFIFSARPFLFGTAGAGMHEDDYMYIT